MKRSAEVENGFLFLFSTWYRQGKFQALHVLQGWKNFLFATRHNGTTPKKSVAKLEPGLKTWSPKQNTIAKNFKTVQKKQENCRYT